jgi:vacuolar protein sorting-associated protein 13A/C
MNYVRPPNAGGAFKLQIYAPFVIVNKIGEPFALKYRTAYGHPKNAAGTNVFGRHQLDSKDETKPDEELAYLFAYPTNDRRNRSLLRVKDSEWSEPLSFEAVGTTTELTLATTAVAKLETGEACNLGYRIGMRVSEGTGSVRLT